jgi:hypothetical protein
MTLTLPCLCPRLPLRNRPKLIKPVFYPSRLIIVLCNFVRGRVERQAIIARPSFHPRFGGYSLQSNVCLRVLVSIFPDLVASAVLYDVKRSFDLNRVAEPRAREVRIGVLRELSGQRWLDGVTGGLGFSGVPFADLCRAWS